jgi:hypothetical protein
MGRDPRHQAFRAFHAIKAVVPGMRERRWGRIVNIASAHGLVASTGKAAYVAAKHGVVGLTKVVALELANDGVTCNAICPGWVDTPLVERQVEAQAREAGMAVGLRGRRPHTRIVDPPRWAGPIDEAAGRIAARRGLEVVPGKMVWELRPAVHSDKGDAVDRVVADSGTRSVLVAGDDLGDLAAFTAASRLAGEGGSGWPCARRKPRRNCSRRPTWSSRVRLGCRSSSGGFSHDNGRGADGAHRRRAGLGRRLGRSGGDMLAAALLDLGIEL